MRKILGTIVTIQTKNGKAFEYAVLKEFEKKLQNSMR